MRPIYRARAQRLTGHEMALSGNVKRKLERRRDELDRPGIYARPGRGGEEQAVVELDAVARNSARRAGQQDRIAAVATQLNGAYRLATRLEDDVQAVPAVGSHIDARAGADVQVAAQQIRFAHVDVRRV